MSPTTSLTDLTDDALLLILQKLILDNVGLRSLRRCCKYFRNFFSAYQTELRAMRDKALEHAWMDPSPVTASSIRVADKLSEKEEVLMRGEEAHSGGVIFLAACNRFCKIITPHHQISNGQGCISCGILGSRIGAHGVSSEHMENMEMFSLSPT